MKIEVNPYTIHRTRSDTLGLVRLDNGIWRFCVLKEKDGARADGFPVCVGTTYRTRNEAIVDLPRYAEQWGETL